MVRWGKTGSKNTRRIRLGRNYPGKGKMEGFDGGGEATTKKFNFFIQI
jgi:hypothetical protein